MAYRRLLLPLTGTAAGEAALATALITARLWNAHVHCLHVRVDARDVAPLAGEGLSGAMIEEMMAATERESGERAGRVRVLFDSGRPVLIAPREPPATIGTRVCIAWNGSAESAAAVAAALPWLHRAQAGGGVYPHEDQRPGPGGGRILSSPPRD